MNLILALVFSLSKTLNGILLQFEFSCELDYIYIYKCVLYAFAILIRKEATHAKLLFSILCFIEIENSVVGSNAY